MQEHEFYSLLQEQFEAKLPLVAYKLPYKESDKNEMQIKAFLQSNSELHAVKDFNESGFVFAPFDTEKTTFYIPEKASKIISFEKKLVGGHSTSEDIDSKSYSSEEHFSEEKIKYISHVEKAIAKIKSGETQKIVLSRCEKVKNINKEQTALFMELLQAYPRAFVYFWFHPKIGLWMGATPETLLKINGRKFETMALAGTQRSQVGAEVKWGKKERQEQQFVTDSILKNLGTLKIAPEKIQSSEAYTSIAGNLLHLRTDITGVLGTSIGIKQLIEALHPTPAVCGLPKEKAKKFILEEEGYNREFYTGFLGELNLKSAKSRARNKKNIENLAYRTVKNSTNLFVNLRCMKIEGGVPEIFIGGGITRESVAEDEWEETLNKAKTMKKVLLK